MLQYSYRWTYIIPDIRFQYRWVSFILHYSYKWTYQYTIPDIHQYFQYRWVPSILQYSYRWTYLQDHHSIHHHWHIYNINQFTIAQYIWKFCLFFSICETWHLFSIDISCSRTYIGYWKVVKRVFITCSCTADIFICHNVETVEKYFAKLLFTLLNIWNICYHIILLCILIMFLHKNK